MKIQNPILRALKELKSAGSQCSNCCFNLSQKRSISNRDQLAMKKAYTAWDVALATFDAELKNEKP